MKKFILIVFTLIGIGYYAAGQPGLTKGSVMVGGKLHLNLESNKDTYGSQTEDGPKRTDFTIYPRAGYFVADNFATGIGIGYNYYNYSDETDYDTYKYTRGLFLAELFGRYYVHPLTHAACFAELNIGFGAGNAKDEYTYLPGSTEVTETKVSMFGVNLNPGATVFISDRLGIEFTYGTLGYRTYTEKDPDSDETSKETTSNFTLSFNPGTLTFGVFYYFD